jgi:cold shock protein
MGLASPLEAFFGHGAVLRGRFHGNRPQSPTGILVPTVCPTCDRRKVINSGGPVCRSGCACYRPVVTLEATLAKGTVKWFNATKGYGFIQPVGGGGRDVFVHISAVERAGLSTLSEGQTVEYEEVANRGKTSAENLKVAGR